jgi:hypothetical protein
VEDLIDKQEIEALMKSKFYAGFSLSPDVIKVLRLSLENEYGISIESLESKLKERKFCKKINKSYKRHLKSYIDAVKTIKSMQKEQSNGEHDFISVIEQFKTFKAKANVKQEKVAAELVFQEEIAEEDESDQGKRYTSFILYMAIQEMIKHVFVTCKEKGKLFLKLFKKYFEEQERHWFKMLSDLQEVIETLKQDREYLLCKFIDKSDKVVDTAFLKEDILGVLNDEGVNDSNLIEHKRVIKQLIGFINREEDERYLVGLEKKNVEKDVKDIIYSWDLIRANLDFKERIKKVNVDKIREDFNCMDEVRLMKRDD